jgi:thiol-disulfide isomerase/thioredoxin
MVRSPFRSGVRAVLGALCALILLVVRKAEAGDNLNVQDWLGQPGVRLVAVEFYATWCEPCMKAMPRWKALKEKYASQGLRVVVVNTQDPDGACRALPFVPDETVCDLSGRVADAFNLQGKLPSAFLWSWQGNLLVAKGHIEEVERAVDAYFKAAPRVVIEAGADLPAGTAAAVTERLTEAGKVLVVASAEERAAIEAAKKAQQGAGYDERLACEIGKEVPPNALLKVSRVAQAGAGTFLNVGIYDLTSGCLLASASSEWQSDLRRMTQDAVAKLERKLKRADGYQRPATAEGATMPGKGPAAGGDTAWRRSAGWWTLGSGVALLAGGGVFASLAKSGGDDVRAASDACKVDASAPCASQSAVDSALLDERIANVGLYAGGALAILGSYWLFTAPSTEVPKALELRVGPSSVAVGGSF